MIVQVDDFDNQGDYKNNHKKCGPTVYNLFLNCLKKMVDSIEQFNFYFFLSGCYAKEANVTVKKARAMET